MKLASTCYKTSSGSCVKVLKEDGSLEAVDIPIEHKQDWTVEDVIIDVVKRTEIPLTALPYLTLTKTKTRTTINFRNKSFLKPQYGLPFFENFVSENQTFYLRINTSFLPDLDLCKQVLGQRGLAMVIHQVLSDLPASPPTAQLTGVAADDIAFHRRRQAIIAGMAYLSSMEPPPSPGRAESDDKDAFLSKSVDKVTQIRRDYCLGYHKHVYGKITEKFRTVLRKEQSFIQGMLDSVSKYMYNGNVGQFWDQIHDLNSEAHPLSVLLSTLQPCTNIDGNVLCAQLDELKYNLATKMLEVSYFKNHCICEKASCRVSAPKMAFVARFLSIWNPDVRCVTTDKEVTITPRLLQFYRNYNIRRPVPRKSSFCKTLNEKADFDVVKESNRFCGKAAIVLQQHEATTSDFFSTDLKTLRKRGGENGDDKEVPTVAAKNLRPAGFMLRITGQQKPALERPPQLPPCEDKKEGYSSKVFKCRRNNEFFARKELRPDILDIAAVSLKWRSNLEKAYDCYDPVWLLHPVQFLDTAANGTPIAISPWLELGSLRDLLVDRTPDSPFSFRHLLQLAAQLGTALAYLNDALQMKVTGIHPANVLVTEFHVKPTHQLGIRLAEAGTLVFPRNNQIDWHDEMINIPRDNPNLLPVLQTLYLIITWAHELDQETKELWHQFRSCPDCFSLIVCAREMLKGKSADYLRRPLISNKTKSPSIMNPNADAGQIVKNLSDDFVQTQDFEKRLGEGNSAEVYLVRVSVDKQQKRLVAVKILNRDARVRMDFSNEIKIHGLLSHKNIIRFLDASPERNLLVTEYANKGSLVKYVRKQECSDEVRRRFCREICEGMNYLHSRTPSIIHRDLACRNILLNYDRAEGLCIKITDFGLSRIPEDEVYYRSETSTSQLPIYWLPHKDIQSKRITKKLDVWSFGVCLWEIFTNGLCPRNYFTRTPNSPPRDYRVDNLPKEYDGKTIPDPIYDVMLNCWKECDERPSFEELQEQFPEVQS